MRPLRALRLIFVQVSEDSCNQSGTTAVPHFCYNFGMTAQLTLLLADDEAAITDNLAPFLERSGFTVLVAADGEMALAQVKEANPDLIILDVLMPRLDGRAVLRQLRQHGGLDARHFAHAGG